MAEDDIQSGLVTADAEPAGNQSPNQTGPAKKLSPIAGRPQVIRLGEGFLGNRAFIIDVKVDGQSAGSTAPKVKSDSNIVITGRGLDNLDFWDVERTGRSPLDFVKRRVATPNQVVLNLADAIGGALEEGERFGLTFFSSKFGGRMLTIPAVFIFSNKKDQDKSEEKEEKSEESKKASVAAEAVAEGLAGPAGALPSGAVGARAPSQKISQAEGAAKALSEMQDADDGVEGEVSSQTSATAVLPETARQSFEAVGEYIDKNPQVIANTQIRSEVLSALGSGSLAGLSGEARSVLEGSVKSEISSSGSVQLRAAMDMVSRESGAGARISTSVQKETAVSGSISGQATSGGGSAQLNLRQNLEVVGEHLDKNPGLIPNTKIRGEISQALASGDTGGLSAEAKETLQSTLKTLGQNPSPQSEQVTAAARQLRQPPEPVDSKTASPAKADVPAGPAVGAGPQPPQAETPPSQSNISKPSSAPPLAAQTSPGKGKIDAANGQGQEGTGVSAAGLAKQPLPSQGRPYDRISPQAAAGLGAALPKTPSGGQSILDKLKANNRALGEKLGNISPNKDKAAEDATLKKAASGPMPVGLDGGTGLSAGGKAPEASSAGDEDKILPKAPEQVGARGSGDDESALALKKENENSPDRDEPQDDEAQALALNNQPAPAVAAPRLPVAVSKATEEAAVLANEFINDFLLEGAWLVWVFALPSFGLSVLLGAVLGDFLWVFKNSLLDFAAKRVALPLLKGDLMQQELENIKDKIKFGLAVKVNVLLMNLICLAAAFIILIFSVTLTKALCDNFFTGSAAYMAGYSDVCKSLDNFTAGGGGGGGGGSQASFAPLTAPANPASSGVVPRP